MKIQILNSTKHFKAVIHGVQTEISEKQNINETEEQNATEVKRVGCKEQTHAIIKPDFHFRPLSLAGKRFLCLFTSPKNWIPRKIKD